MGSTDFPPTPTLTRAFCHFHPLMRFLYSFNISLLVAQIYIARGVFTIVFLSQVPPNQTVRDSHPLSTDFYSRKNKRCQLLDQRLTCHDNQVGSRDISVEINVSSAKWTYLVLSANLSQGLSRFLLHEVTSVTPFVSSAPLRDFLTFNSSLVSIYTPLWRDSL